MSSLKPMGRRPANSLRGVARQRVQRGVASLTVVMLLFFAVALAAAYSSRSMIFEQRTTTNQLRSTLAFEAAQGGLEWALALLNSGRITPECTASADTAHTSFRQRYLSINATTGMVTRLEPPGGGDLLPTCVLENGSVRCDCPSNAAPTLSAPTSSAVTTAFRVRFVNVASRPWTTQIEVNGCTKLDDACLNFPSGAVDQEGRATITALVTLRTAMNTAPGAAVTSRGDVVPAAGPTSLIAYNTDASVSGITVQSGGDIDIVESRLRSLPGTPGLQSKLANDISFASAALPGDPLPIGDRFFASFFGMWPSTYLAQPGVVVVDCGGGTCNDGQVRSAISLNPGRMIWVRGGLSVDSAADIGSAAAPVQLFIDGGSLTFTAAATVYGVVYVNRTSALAPAAFNLSGPGQIRGGLISEHALTAAGDTTIVFDKAIGSTLRITQGSFVLVPGSWKDF